MTTANNSSIEINWVVTREDAPSDIARLYFDTLQELLPEALPATFQTYDDADEDLNFVDRNVADEGLQKLIDLWQSDTKLDYNGVQPFHFGCVRSLGRLQEESQDQILCSMQPVAVGTMSISLVSSFLERDGNESRLRQLIVTVARRCCASVAFAMVERAGLHSNPAITKGRKFHGLPVGDVWLAWFGTTYLPLLSEGGRKVAGLVFSNNSSEAIFEIKDAWRGSQRPAEPSLRGRLPHRLFQIPAGNEIRMGVSLSDAFHIPRKLNPIANLYRALVWTVPLVDLTVLTETLKKHRLEVALCTPGHVKVIGRSNEFVRLRSALMSSTRSFYSFLLKRMIDDATKRPHGRETATKMEDYSQQWEVTGSIRDDFWATVQALASQHEFTVWMDISRENLEKITSSAPRAIRYVSGNSSKLVFPGNP